MLVKYIEKTREPDGYHFYAVLEIRNETVRVEVTPELLLDYVRFQTELLKQTGEIWRYLISEGKPVEAANEHWKAFATELMSAAPQHMAPATVLN
jgi:hypothetical protein